MVLRKVVLVLLLCVFRDAACASKPTLRIEAFGGKADGVTNNAVAFKKAAAACEASRGCTVVFAGPGTYRTSAINMTTNMTLQVNSGVVLQGTETNEDNCGAPVLPSGKLGNCTDNIWPILPWREYPSIPSRAPGPTKQGWIHSYNVSNIEITGGGTLDGAGPWWWCTRMYAYLKAFGKGFAKAQATIDKIWGCRERINAGQVGWMPYGAGGDGVGDLLHIVESSHVHIHNVTFQNSPVWNVHLQFSRDILFENNHAFNVNNGTFEAPNGDGIDVDSCRDVIVRNSVFDVGDDALCVKSGAGWPGGSCGGCFKNGTCVGRPTENVLFIDNEVRNGHGLTIGSDWAGGVRNITFKNIFLNAFGGPQPSAATHRPIGGPHVKAIPEESPLGSVMEDVTWDNIYGTNAVADFDSAYKVAAHQCPNASSCTTIRNIAWQNINLETVAPAEWVTAVEHPIENLTFRNVTLSRGWSCDGYKGESKVHNRIYATGTAQQVSPPLGACSFNPPVSVFV